MLIVALLATFMAQDRDSSILDLVSYAWGAVSVAVWKPLSGGPAGIFGMFEVAPGFALSLLVSRLGEGRRERESFETQMNTWRRPQDSSRELTAAKAQGVSHEQ